MTPLSWVHSISNLVEINELSTHNIYAEHANILTHVLGDTDGSRLNTKIVYSGMGIATLKIRLSRDRLIFNIANYSGKTTS